MLSRFLIPKEEVASLKFLMDDVLTNNNDRAKRKISLMRALTLGNAEQSKVQIVLRDATGIKVVHTTIWGVTDQNIILKYGMVIPIRSVVYIEIV